MGGRVRRAVPSLQGKAKRGGQTAVSLPSSQKASSPPRSVPHPHSAAAGVATSRAGGGSRASRWSTSAARTDSPSSGGGAPKSPPARLPSASRERQRARATRGRGGTLTATARTKVGGLWLHGNRNWERDKSFSYWQVGNLVCPPPQDSRAWEVRLVQPAMRSGQAQTANRTA